MNNKESNFVSAVVYLHSEDDNTYDFLQMLDTTLSNNFKAYEIILVDDNVDASVIETIRRFKNDHPHVICSIISMGFKHGLEASMNAGVDLAIGDFVFEFDSCYIDYPQDLIMEIYKISLKENFDIVYASPKKNRISSKLFYAIYNKYSKTTTPIATERFQVVSRRALNRIYSYSKNIPYRKSVYSSIGLNIYQLKYDKIDNTSGKPPKAVFNFSTAINSLILFTDLTYRVTFGLSLFMAFLMLVSGTYTVIVYFGQTKPVPGWAPLMGLISLGFFAIFTVFTIIIKYLDVLLGLVFKRQKYMISGIEKL